MQEVEQAMYQSLVEGPLLVGDLPEGVCLDRNGFRIPPDPPSLNVQQKLGHLYEAVLATLLEASPGYAVLARNVQLQLDIHRTVGELDFLLRDLASGQCLHLELATKFYLAVETEQGLMLPGPDARDNYHRKLAKMRGHQLQLLQKVPDLLPEQWQAASIGVRQLVYGCLFDHVDAEVLAMPEFIAPGCRRGRWLEVQRCEDVFGKGAKIDVIPKALWPVPLEMLTGVKLERWEPTEELQRCVMVRVDDETIPTFVVPEGYAGFVRDNITSSPARISLRHKFD